MRIVFIGVCLALFVSFVFSFINPEAPEWAISLLAMMVCTTWTINKC